MHIAVDAYRMPIKIHISNGKSHDSQKLKKRILGDAEYFITDKGYISKIIIEFTKKTK